MNKTKHFMNLAALAVAAMLIGSVTSCGKNDPIPPDPDPIISYIPSPTITDSNGKNVQVTKAGYFSFTYDTSGKLSSINFDGKNILQDGDEFILSDRNFNAKIYLYSKKDLIAKIECTEIEGGSDGEVFTHVYNYKYNSDNRLIKVTETGSVKAKDGGSGSFTTNVNYKWENGNLTQITYHYTEKGKDDGESYSEDDTMELTYTYGTQVNSCKQFPYCISDETDAFLGYGVALSTLGLFGFGPAYLPTSYKETVTSVIDGKAHESSKDNRTLSFTLNSNGTLNLETDNGNRINYSYASK